jgi:hypothetical protein
MKCKHNNISKIYTDIEYCNDCGESRMLLEGEMTEWRMIRGIKEVSIYMNNLENIDPKDRGKLIVGIDYETGESSMRIEKD